MKKLVALAAIATSFMASQAHAATTLTFSGNPSGSGASIPLSGQFTYDYDATTSTLNPLSLALSVNGTAYTLADVVTTFTSGSDLQISSLNQFRGQGTTFNLFFRGISASGVQFTSPADVSLLGGPGAYYPIPFTQYQDFNLRVSAVATAVPSAVPEPATWALMLIGFGAIGASLRRKRSGVLTAHLA